MDGTTLVRSRCLWGAGYPRFYQEIATGLTALAMTEGVVTRLRRFEQSNKLEFEVLYKKKRPLSGRFFYSLVRSWIQVSLLMTIFPTRHFSASAPLQITKIQITGIVVNRLRQKASGTMTSQI